MSPEQIELARHALGLTRQKVSFRNYFVTGPGSDDYDNWVAMVKAGFATQTSGNQITGGDDLFRLTDAGKTAAVRPGETIEA